MEGILDGDQILRRGAKAALVAVKHVFKGQTHAQLGGQLGLAGEHLLVIAHMRVHIVDVGGHVHHRVDHRPLGAQHRGDFKGAQRHGAEKRFLFGGGEGALAAAAIGGMGLGKHAAQALSLVADFIHLLLPVIQVQGGLAAVERAQVHIQHGKARLAAALDGFNIAEMLSAFSPIAEQRGHGTKTHMHITSFADLYSIIVAQKL